MGSTGRFAVLPNIGKPKRKNYMHAFELQRNIDRFSSEIESFQPFFATVSALAKAAEGINASLEGLAVGGTKLNESAGHIHNLLAGVNQSIPKGNHRQFFRALEHFQRAVAELQSSPSELITKLNAQVENFSSLYDTFLSNQGGKYSLPLVLAAQQLQAKIELIFDLLQLFEESVASHDVPSGLETSLALWLPAYTNLTDFAQRLLALQSLYSELCMLLSISEVEHPLRISKIESGSLWAKVFGESKVIGMMASFVEQTASWLYRNYTNEGKLAAIPRKVETIDALLGLTTRLNAAGFDTESMQEHIEKSAVAISKDLAILLEGQPSVTVNEKTISVGTELGKLLLQKSESLRLDGPASSNQDGSAAMLPPPQ
ncbi:hypothetical protein AB4Z46_04175 [Variovorax sp. M-6]|uniref:hypothetical protein n=1 Tax=Variovorax sp. M-6 TaxID=3233041 RepID=UPI003F9D7EBD